jgi:hypothetical protein
VFRSYSFHIAATCKNAAGQHSRRRRCPLYVRAHGHIGGRSHGQPRTLSAEPLDLRKLAGRILSPKRIQPARTRAGAKAEEPLTGGYHPVPGDTRIRDRYSGTIARQRCVLERRRSGPSLPVRIHAERPALHRLRDHVIRADITDSGGYRAPRDPRASEPATPTGIPRQRFTCRRS